MKRRRLLFILLSVAALGLLIWLVLPAREPEPSYQGKPLRKWLEGYPNYPSGFADVQVREAISQIGTNAIPILLRLLEENDSPLKLKWIALAQKQHIFKPPQKAWHRNVQALFAFEVLGPAASNAVPELVRIYDRKISFESQIYVLVAFRSIGPSVFPTANPVFLEALTNQNRALRMQAANGVGESHLQPDVFVPALMASLKDYDPAVAECIVRALGAYGPAAKSAVPALIELYGHDPNQRAAWGAINYVEVANALQAIDPQAAASAGIK